MQRRGGSQNGNENRRPSVGIMYIPPSYFIKAEGSTAKSMKLGLKITEVSRPGRKLRGLFIVRRGQFKYIIYSYHSEDC